MDDLEKPFHPEVTKAYAPTHSESSSSYELPTLPRAPLFSDNFWDCILVLCAVSGAFSLGIACGLSMR